MLPDLLADPFGERLAGLPVKRMQLLGARFRFDSNSVELMRLVDWAYKGLPRHRLSQAAGDLRVSLRLHGEPPRQARGEPAPLAMLSGSGLLGGATEAANFALLSPREQAAVVVVSPRMLRFPYHTRYELIEFAVFTLAARAQRLVPLHAACVGEGGRGLLLLGESGAGKSTVALQCLLRGFDFLSEDSVFVTPDTLKATGIANFVHVRADSLHWLGRSRESALIRRSPIIRRRSGVRKFELDLRQDGFRLARSPLRLVGAAILSPQGARGRPLLKPISSAALLDNLAQTQSYGASRPEWRAFQRSVARLDAFELRRGRHPCEAADALRSLLAGS